ncbi:hypothetical protein [Pseudoalteromonas sp. CH_XMU1449-3]|uniref:hypothetical protein n=1 Tax=Pseudoalteromonas sp. CH_XMU1449-3 TaxID=3107774 RepID=UPI00300A8109
MKTIVGLPTIKNFQRCGISPQSLFKRLAIYFDEIVFHSNGCMIENGQTYGLASNFLSIVSASDMYEASALASNKEFKNLFVNCWDYLEDADDFEESLYDSVNNDVLNKIFSYAYEQKQPEGEFILTKEFKQLCGDMWADIRLYAGFKNLEPNVAGNLGPQFANAMTNVANNEGYSLNELSQNSNMIPDFSDLSWEQIFELRKDKCVTNFRDKIESSLKDNPDNLTTSIDSEIISALWDITNYAKPNIAMTTLNGILTNCPSPIIVNPYGVGKSIKEGFDAKKLLRDKGWVFFIQKAKEEAETASNKRINRDK